MKTDNEIFKLRTEILNAVNNKLLVGWILCDLEKVFYCADLCILLSKLKFCGINGNNFAFYKFYLHNRYIGTAIYNDSDKSDRVSV